MHKDIFVYLQEHKDKAKNVVDFYLEETVSNKYEGILNICGISGTGKSEIAWFVSRELYKKGISSHVVNLDRFYKVNADVRNTWRKKTKIIGHEELDWDRIDKEIKMFCDNDTKVLIFEGLYAGYIDGVTFYIEGNIESTEEFRKIRGKEDEKDEWRQYVVGEEYSDILSNMYRYNYTI
jgi:hypothetical protein